MKLEMKKVFSYAMAVFLAAFGLLTLFLSSSVIFDLFGVRAKEGNYVLFIVVSNFISSIIYLVAAYGFMKSKIWTAKLMYIAASVLIVAFAGLFFYINSGGIYETKTIGAMSFRIVLTLGFAFSAYFMIKKSAK